MSSLSEAFASPIQRFDQSWPRLTLDDLGVITEIIREQRRDTARRRAVAEKLSPDQIYNATAYVEMSDILLDEIRVFAMTAKGATAILKQSNKRAGRDDKALSESMVNEPAQLIELALELTGLLSKKKPEPKADEKQPEVKKDQKAADGGPVGFGHPPANPQ